MVLQEGLLVSSSSSGDIRREEDGEDILPPVKIITEEDGIMREGVEGAEETAVVVDLPNSNFFFSQVLEKMYTAQKNYGALLQTAIFIFMQMLYLIP
mmetsp:Transcript_25056/g.57903  ORF Transcript_25056/g.57903 Transcript_25056/m.57903 type:complete len:97 (-) Transcript_25056:120-410(-)